MSLSVRQWRERFGVPADAAAVLAEGVGALDDPEGLPELLERLLERAADHGVAPAWLEPPRAAEAVVRLAYAAPFLVHHLAGHPQALGDGVLAGLGEEGGLLPWHRYADPARVAEADEADVMRWLRLWKYDSYVRITARELTGLHGTRESCALISNLADGLVRVAFDYAFAQHVGRSGLPLRRDGQLAGGAVVGMGKLGGGELNYASDIDLIFFQDGGDRPCRLLEAPPLLPIDPAMPDRERWARWEAVAEASAGAPEGRLSAGEFYNRMARQVIRLLSHHTGEGIGFRVDVDLRPQGRSGLLVPHLAFMEDYYLRQGREWERTAMLKARVLTAPPELQRSFREMIRPFVYRRYLDYSALEGVAIVKHDIDRVHHAALEANLKLGNGGIRESEFLVQALQLLYGGKKPEIQVTGHEAAVHRLVDTGVLGAQDGERMLADYWLLRRLENRIQMVDEAQTCELPEMPEDRLRVFHDFRPGFRERLANAEAALAEARKRTAARFRELFAGMGPEEFPDPNAWREAVRRFVPAEEQAMFLERIDGLFAGIMDTRLGERCVFKLTRLLARPELYRQGTNAAFPRWVEFIAQIGNRNAIYTLIDSQPPLVPWVSWIFCEGGRHAEILIRHPEFLESFFSIAEPFENWEQRFGEVLEQARDDEEFILELQTVKAQSTIRVLTTYLNQEDDSGHRTALSEVADATVGACTRYAWRKVVERIGLPEGAQADRVSGFAVLALGKLGSRELHFGSDLDLVFVYRSEGTTSKGRSHYEFYTKLTQTLGNLLTSQTMFGRLYDLDHRLRPFGGKGVLVPSLSAYESFLAPDGQAGADVWNFQSFTRIRPVCGDAALAAELVALIARAWQARALDCGAVAESVRDMLGRLVAQQAPSLAEGERVLPLKYAIGGLIGYEFLRQAHFLCVRSRGAPDWTAPPPHEMIAALEPDYREVGALDERLGFHVTPYRHEARPEHFERLAAVGARWRFEEVEALCRRMADRVEDGFRVLAH